MYFVILLTSLLGVSYQETFCPRPPRSCKYAEKLNIGGVGYASDDESDLYSELAVNSTVYGSMNDFSTKNLGLTMTMFGDSRTDLRYPHSFLTASEGLKLNTIGALFAHAGETLISMPKHETQPKPILTNVVLYEGVNLGKGVTVFGLASYVINPSDDLIRNYYNSFLMLLNQYSEVSSKPFSSYIGDWGCTGESLFVVWGGPHNTYTDEFGIIDVPKGGLLHVVVARGNFKVRGDRQATVSHGYWCFTNKKKVKHNFIHMISSKGNNGLRAIDQYRDNAFDQTLKDTSDYGAKITTTVNYCQWTKRFDTIRKEVCGRYENCIWHEGESDNGCYPSDGNGLHDSVKQQAFLRRTLVHEHQCHGVIPMRVAHDAIIPNAPADFMGHSCGVIMTEGAKQHKVMKGNLLETCGHGRPAEDTLRKRRSGFCFIVCFGMGSSHDHGITKSELNSVIHGVNSRIDHDEVGIALNRKRLNMITDISNKHGHELDVLSREVSKLSHSISDAMQAIRKEDDDQNKKISANRINTIILQQEEKFVSSRIQGYKITLSQLTNGGVFKDKVGSDGCITDEETPLEKKFRELNETIFHNQKLNKLAGFNKTTDVPAVEGDDDDGFPIWGMSLLGVGGGLGLLVCCICVIRKIL